MKTRHYHLTAILLIVSLILFICCNGNSKQAPTQKPYSLTIALKKCAFDSTQTYYIALPDTTEPGKKYPVLFAFDPHGNGKQAVDSLDTAASKYGYIVVASNNIRNGYDKTEYALSTLYNEVLNTYTTIDNSRIYAIGFSGGGRVAQYLAAMHPQVAGVISCSAGFSLNDPSVFKTKTLLFIAGNEDFNYNEISQSVNSLQQNRINTYLYEFNGKHEWPSRKLLCDALLWLELDYAQKNPDFDYSCILNDFNNSLNEKIDLLISKNDTYEAWKLCERGIIFNNGLNENSTFTKTAEKLAKEPGFKSQFEKIKQNNALEQRLQQAYIQAMQDKDSVWWKNETNVLTEKAKTAEFQPDKAMYNRILGFLSIMTYSYTNRSLTQNDLKNAAKFILIYKIVDPGNADCIYFNSIYLYKCGNTEASKKEFKKAVDAGFTDFGKAKTELPAGWFN